MDKANPQLQYISLLLQNRDFVEDFKTSTLDLKHFDQDKRMLLSAILEAHEQGVSLSRKSFIDFVSRYTSKKSDISEQELLFNECNFLSADRNDYPMLKGKILDSFLLDATTKYIREFNQQRQNSGNLYAVQQLAAGLTELSTTLSEKRQIEYSDINTTGKDYVERLLKIRAGEEEKREFVSFGIDELDKTSGVGCGSGTLTLFIGDVGGYKTCHKSCIINTLRQGILTVEELFMRVKQGEQFEILQYDGLSGKLVAQPVLDAFDHGVQECFAIRTRLGHRIECTSKHRNLFFGGYKITEEVKIGDRIAVARHLTLGGTQVDLDEAAWLGYMIAEGGTSNSGYNFTNKDPVIVRSMLRATTRCGGRMQTAPDYRRMINGRPYRGRYRVNRLRSLGIKYGLDASLRPRNPFTHRFSHGTSHRSHPCSAPCILATDDSTLRKARKRSTRKANEKGKENASTK
ncbi:MAG: hypothetical protein HC888_02380 [Candidatus Competibacteraceae bacterium]|nr:hypothetical protein [Candidatus Competibacteraceae bacterium]